MITIRKANDRGHFDFGWLNTYHTFSFSEYHDPRHMHFRSLRVINEDRVSGGGGFDTHPHRDMEIITYILEGKLEHKDSMGNGATINVGDVQRMTAGTGVTHSERNPLGTEPVHLLQIWIIPEKRGLTPSYEQKMFSPQDKKNRLRLVASQDGREGSVTVHQDMNLYASVLDEGFAISKEIAKGRHLWVQVARGSLLINGVTLNQGDGASISEEKLIECKGLKPTEILIFDLN